MLLWGALIQCTCLQQVYATRNSQLVTVSRCSPLLVHYMAMLFVLQGMNAILRIAF